MSGSIDEPPAAQFSRTFPSWRSDEWRPDVASTESRRRYFASFMIAWSGESLFSQ
jgi:hypothetical protein